MKSNHFCNKSQLQRPAKNKMINYTISSPHINTLNPKAPTNYHQKPVLLRIRAVQVPNDENPRRLRLIDILQKVPQITTNYFKKPSRRALFGGISLLGGFYVAQTVSLSLGALGVNDVIASVLCVLLVEYITRFYYSRSKVSFYVALLNVFKIGFTYGLFLDAFKLAS